MPRETLNTRVTRREESAQALIHAQMATEERFRELREEDNKLRRETNELERRMDERIDKLVSAIGEWLRRVGGPHA